MMVGWSRMCFMVFVALSPLLSSCYTQQVIKAKLGSVYNGRACNRNSCNSEFIYEIPASENITSVRIHTVLPNATNHSLIFLAKWRDVVQTWQLPVLLKAREKHVHYRSLKITLINMELVEGKSEEIHIWVSGNGANPVPFHLQLKPAQNFILRLNHTITTSVTTSEPQLFSYRSTNDTSDIMMKVNSNSSSLCGAMVVSKAQNWREDVMTEVHKTITTKAAIPVKHSKFGGIVFLNLLVLPDDSECGFLEDVKNRTKVFEVSIIAHTEGYTILYILTTFFVCLLICLIVWITLSALWHFKYNTRKDDIDSPVSLGPVQQEQSSSYKRMEKASEVKYFTWITLIMSITFAIPSIQLVMSRNKVMELTGNEDYCYNNDLCSWSFAGISAFNKVVSNIGYVIFGFLFIVIIRAINMRNEEKGKERIDVFYAMGIALISVGLFSACYHVCPRRSTFLLDVSFMYLLGGLVVVKLYQMTREEKRAYTDPRVHWFFLLICLCIMSVSAAKNLEKLVSFWMLYGFVHMAVIFFISVRLYQQFSPPVDSRFVKKYKNKIKKMEISKMVILAIEMISNLALITVVAVRQIKGFDGMNFSIFMLMTLILKTMFCFSIYIVTRYFSSGENSRKTLQSCLHLTCHKLLTIILSVLSITLWAIALSYFYNFQYSWKKSAAKSRQHNKECLILGYFDNHDMWHFLSSFAILSSFLVLLHVAEDITNWKQRVDSD
uniref:SID1 transmembrane family member 2-like isoform X2 n=1 Tax=Myxine glutinosa TaxID=7769 RepID=UPI00358E0345